MDRARRRSRKRRDDLLGRVAFLGDGPSFDDDREARRLSKGPLQIPKDVDLPVARTKDDLDPLVVDVSLAARRFASAIVT